MAATVVNFATGVPRRTNKGLLVEEARTNLLIRSQEFDTWSPANVTVTANAATAPDGTSTADRLTTTVAAYPSVFRAVTVAAATAHTLSVFAKADTSSTLSLEFRGGFGTPDAVFNLAAGTVAVTRGSATITALANGWYRCTVTITSADTSELVIIGLGTTVTIGDSIYLWGAQLEAFATALSYVPTTSATATRGIDVAAVTVPAGMSLYEATYNGGLTATGAVTPGASFDLVTGRPWLNGYLERLEMT